MEKSEKSFEVAEQVMDKIQALLDEHFPLDEGELNYVMRISLLTTMIDGQAIMCGKDPVTEKALIFALSPGVEQMVKDEIEEEQKAMQPQKFMVRL